MIQHFNIDEIMTLYVLVRNDYFEFHDDNSDYANMLCTLLKKLKATIELHDKFELIDGDYKDEKEV